MLAVVLNVTTSYRRSPENLLSNPIMGEPRSEFMLHTYYFGSCQYVGGLHMLVVSGKIHVCRGYSYVAFSYGGRYDRCNVTGGIGSLPAGL